MPEDATAALAKAHQTLTDGAAVSKRTIAAQRRILREQSAALEEVEAAAKALGLRLHTTQAKEAIADD